MTYIQTAYGGRYDILSPDPDEITIKDVAHALSNVCRFGGHCVEFYSVAQHCVLLSRAVRGMGHEGMTIRTALMHDAHEAYVGDIPTPIKALIGFDLVESAAWDALSARFRLPREIPLPVKRADARLLVTEATQLLREGPQGDGWPDVEPFPDLAITPWIPERARLEFLMEARRCDIY